MSPVKPPSPRAPSTVSAACSDSRTSAGHGFGEHGAHVTVGLVVELVADGHDAVVRLDLPAPIAAVDLQVVPHVGGDGVASTHRSAPRSGA
jgi:hypothetical protein